MCIINDDGIGYINYDWEAGKDYTEEIPIDYSEYDIWVDEPYVAVEPIVKPVKKK